VAKKHHKYGKLAYEASVKNRRENLLFLPFWQAVLACFIGFLRFAFV